jgi:hypothetical protein
MIETLDYLRSGAPEYPQAIIRDLVVSPQNAGGHEGQLEFEQEWELISQAAKFDAAEHEAVTIAEEAPPTRTVLGPDEVSLESVSMALAKGPVVIKATDAQARRIMERHRRDAFRPE